jgi:hypothetical protein
MSKGGPYGFQALAAEVTDYSKKTFDDAIRTWEQLMGRQIAGIGSRNPISIRQASLRQPLSKLGEMCVSMARNATKSS